MVKITTVFKIFRWIALGIFGLSFILTILFGWINASEVVSTYLTDAQCDLPQAACDILVGFGFYYPMLSMKYFIWYTFVPLAAIGITVYNFIQHSFSNNLAIGLSILVALACVPSGVLLAIDAILLSILGQYAFLGGLLIGFLSVGEGIAYVLMEPEIRKEKTMVKSLEKDERKLTREISNLKQKIISENIDRRTGEYRKIMQQIAEKEAKLKKLNEKRMMLAEVGAGG